MAIRQNSHVIINLFHIRRENMIKCNRGCGATDLRWKVVKGNYKLFDNDNLLHICNDGLKASTEKKEQATAVILSELNLNSPNDIPDAETHVPTFLRNNLKEKDDNHGEYDPAKMFTITTTASGIAITGDDKNNPIYLPKVAVPEIVKALVDFIC